MTCGYEITYSIERVKQNASSQQKQLLIATWHQRASTHCSCAFPSAGYTPRWQESTAKVIKVDLPRHCANSLYSFHSLPISKRTCLLCSVKAGIVAVFSYRCQNPHSCCENYICYQYKFSLLVINSHTKDFQQRIGNVWLWTSVQRFFAFTLLFSLQRWSQRETLFTASFTTMWRRSPAVFYCKFLNCYPLDKLWLCLRYCCAKWCNPV